MKLNKAMFYLFLGFIGLIGVFLIVPSGLDPMSVVEGYNEISEDNSSRDIGKSLFITYIETIYDTQESGESEPMLEIPKYLQGDYPEKRINNSLSGTISSSGCGYTCYAMLVSYVSGKDITPDKFVDTIVPSTGKRIGDDYSGNGINQIDIEPAVEEVWGIKSKQTRTSSSEILKIVKEQLDKGMPVCVGVDNRPWTNNEHRILITGWADKTANTVYVLDPNARYNAGVLGMTLEQFYNNPWKIPDKFSWYVVVTFEF